MVRDRSHPRSDGGLGGDGAPSLGRLAGATRRGDGRRRQCSSRWASLAGESKEDEAPIATAGDLVQVLAVFGFVVVVSAIYLVVVLGLGHAPKTTGDKEVLALSMVASGVAALIFVPVRRRAFSSESATRFVSRDHGRPPTRCCGLFVQQADARHP